MNAASRHGSEIATRDDWVFDASLAILAITLVLAPYLAVIALYADLSQRELLIAAAVGGGLAIAIVFRRHHPLLFLILVTALVAAHVVFVPLPFSMLVTVLAAVHAASRYLGRITWWVLLLWVPGGAACVLRWYVIHPASDSLRLVAILGAISFVGLVVGAYAVGRRGYDLAQVRDLEIGAALEEQRQMILASTAAQRAEEEIVRSDIADLLSEDVVRTLTSVSVKAEEAKALIPGYPAQATRSIEGLLTTVRETMPLLLTVARALRGEPTDEIWAHTESELATAQSSALDWVSSDPPEPPAPSGPPAATLGSATPDPPAAALTATATSTSSAVPAASPTTLPGTSGLGAVTTSPPPLVTSPSPVAPPDLVATPPVVSIPARQPPEPPRPTPLLEEIEEEYVVGGLDDIADLVTDVGAGLTLNGEPPDGLDPIIGETLFFIIDEALANVQKHAGPQADPQVLIDWGDEDIEVSITNAPTSVVSLGGGGNGLDEMAERVGALNGMLETGPLDDGGFHVWANLPYQP